ncbi:MULTISPECIES: MFS transporter [Microbacterium]|uniref:MFS transporter n=1 Tax=Microbacterium TaxID=33882 RepID=UPI00217E8BB9|nr:MULTISPECIES: MFS transporter [Microbacterium]
MTTTAPLPVASAAPPRLRYGALLAMMTMSFLLVTAEFLPNGVLTEIAAELRVTPGQAGQMVTVTALVGLFVAPTIGLALPRLDRRALLVWMAAAAAASNAIVAIAPTLPLLLLARVLLGAALSGFWAMSITVAARIAGPERLGRAVMFTSAGTSLATVAGVPIGVMLSAVIDWRGVFALAALATGLLAVALRLLLPSVPAENVARLSVLLDTLRRPGIALGVAGHVLVVLGHFLAYTYIRLALERVQADGQAVDAGRIVLLLALFGIGGFHSRPGSAWTASRTRSRKGSPARCGQPSGAQPIVDQARIRDCSSVVAIIRQMTRSPSRFGQSPSRSAPMCWARAAAAGSSRSKPWIHAAVGSSPATSAERSSRSSSESRMPDPAGSSRASGSRESSASPARSSSGRRGCESGRTTPSSTYTRLSRAGSRAISSSVL